MGGSLIFSMPIIFGVSSIDSFQINQLKIMNEGVEASLFGSNLCILPIFSSREEMMLKSPPSIQYSSLIRLEKSCKLFRNFYFSSIRCSPYTLVMKLISNEPKRINRVAKLQVVANKFSKMTMSKFQSKASSLAIRLASRAMDFPFFQHFLKQLLQQYKYFQFLVTYRYLVILYIPCYIRAGAFSYG